VPYASIAERSDPNLRKLLNRALFSKILIQVIDRRVRIEAVPHEVYEQLLKLPRPFASDRTPGPMAAPGRTDRPGGRPSPKRTNPTSRKQGRGSHVYLMAERAGFEPAMEREPHTRLAPPRCSRLRPSEASDHGSRQMRPSPVRLCA
jgi:hypothetical protein